MHPATYRALINRAIKPFGLKVLACPRNGGYSYFVDLKTGDQIGESVYTYRQQNLDITRWVYSAQVAREDHEKNRENKK